MTDGVVLRDELVTILDTRELPWEGGARKTLAPDTYIAAGPWPGKTPLRTFVVAGERAGAYLDRRSEQLDPIGLVTLNWRADDEPGGGTALDTRAMPWEDWGRSQGYRFKVLSRDAAGDPTVMLVWFPGGQLVSQDVRHIHRTVRERHFVLTGELAVAQDGIGRVMLKEGWYLDRRPGSVHGYDAGGASPVGCVLLLWRDGPGTFSQEAAYAAESFHV